MKLRTIVSILVGSVALAAASSAVHADSIQVFGAPVTSAAGGGNTNFTYTVVLTQGNELHTGDYFTLVDFAGYIGVSSINPSAGGAWALTDSSMDATTPTGPATSVTATTANIANPTGSFGINDSNTIPDLTFQYTGPILTSAGPGNLTLGTFTITSSLSAANGSSRILGVDHQTSTTFGANNDPYITPSAPLAAPLPAAAWGGLSLMGALVGGKALRRRRR